MALFRFIPLAGVGLAYALAKLTSRESYFIEYCYWCDKSFHTPMPSLLFERLKHVYGEAFAEEARQIPNQAMVREVLHKMSTLKFWFADPMELLQQKKYSDKPVN